MSNIVRDQPQDIAIALFQFLEDNVERYCVVGDTSDLPSRINGDLDIVVSPRDFSRILDTLHRFCRLYDLRLVQIIQHEQTGLYFVIGWIDAEGIPQFLHPDICSDYRRLGRPFLTAEELLTGRRTSSDKTGHPKGFYEPAPEKDFIYYLIKRIDKGELGKRQARHLTNRWNENADGAKREIARFWSEPHTELLVSAAASGNWRTIESNLTKLHRALRQRVGRRWQCELHEIRRKVSRVFRPTGWWLVLLGPDGSGKSSVSAQVIAAMKPAFRRSHAFHFWPWPAPMQSSAIVTDPHAELPRGAIGSAVKALYYAVRYGAGYLSTMKPMLIRSTLIVFDRYYHDILVDPRRYRYGGPEWLVRGIGKLIPRPHLWLVLDAPAATLQARKAEVSPQECERQRAAYREFAVSLPNALVIDTARPLSLVVTGVCEAMLDCLAHRISRRYRLGSSLTTTQMGPGKAPLCRNSLMGTTIARD